MADTPPIHYATALVERERANRAMVRRWLYLVCLLVFALVIVGGATRLTDSGLSITEWKPVHGVIPPLSQDAWLEEFEKYKSIPEYREINKGMSLLAFKVIYWWEWAHRFLGRIVGVVFVLPLVWFWRAGKLESRMKPRLLVLLALGALQGAVGWWMVASGLTERVDVSQYRLAVHLTLACIVFGYALWLARAMAPHAANLAPTRLLVFSPLIVLMALCQIFAGALVAGLDAGLAFNDWPMMDGAFVPTDLFILEPAWRNFFENPKLVQFAHRYLGYAVLVVILLQWLSVRANSDAGPHRRRAAVLFLLAVLQALLGIVTLVLQVPLHIALAHQAGAVILLGMAVAHWRGVLGAYPPLTAIDARG